MELLLLWPDLVVHLLLHMLLLLQLHEGEVQLMLQLLGLELHVHLLQLLLRYVHRHGRRVHGRNRVQLLHLLEKSRARLGLVVPRG